jgi:hypothetical protein
VFVEEFWQDRIGVIESQYEKASCHGNSCIYSDGLITYRETPNGRKGFGVGPGAIGRASNAASGLASRGFAAPAAGTRVVPNGIPSGWRIRSTRGEGGVRYLDPQNAGNAVRVMPGNPSSPYATSRAPYVRWQRNGQALDVNGNAVPKNSPEAHIPLDRFRFDSGLFK